MVSHYVCFGLTINPVLFVDVRGLAFCSLEKIRLRIGWRRVDRRENQGLPDLAGNPAAHRFISTKGGLLTQPCMCGIRLHSAKLKIIRIEIDQSSWLRFCAQAVSGTD